MTPRILGKQNHPTPLSGSSNSSKLGTRTAPWVTIRRYLLYGPKALTQESSFDATEQRKDIYIDIHSIA